MKITEQGDGIVQGAGCGSVVGQSFSEEATFQLRPEGNGLAKGWSGSEAFQAEEAQEQSQASLRHRNAVTLLPSRIPETVMHCLYCLGQGFVL